MRGSTARARTEAQRRSTVPLLHLRLLPWSWTKTHLCALLSTTPASAPNQTPQISPALGQSVRTMTPAVLQGLLSSCPQSPYSSSPTAATRDTDTLPLQSGEWEAVCLMAPLFASTRAWMCRMTAASTSTTVRAGASAALLLSCTPLCSPCPSFWTLQAWRTGLAVLGPMLCGKNGCSRPAQNLSSWGPGPLWTGHLAGSTRGLLLTATQTFVYTANPYTAIRDQKRSLECDELLSRYTGATWTGL